MILNPILQLYLDVDPAEGALRARGQAELDRIEQQGIDFFHRTRQRYYWNWCKTIRKPPLLMLVLWHKYKTGHSSSIKIGGFHRSKMTNLSWLVPTYNKINETL